MLTLVVLISLSGVFLYSYSIQSKESREYELSLIYHNMIGEIQDFKNQNTSLLSGFSAYIQMNDINTDEDIYMYLDCLLRDHLDEIRNIGIFKGATIVWVYPFEGNEDAISFKVAKALLSGCPY